eukprot:CAMPEP_0173428626 /NCGR_PEP_ID=MMETSP1357-20121228/7537_1 /TAXON_ID=77926 /ORGANISM="Hemiselmis rufescens, Strain PCC563" /LENGTH=378 /DNA_ID=CAMNT_0014392679 /DNA_START=28 /DNA_END=1164 /DNA_ORIENTATION=-
MAGRALLWLIAALYAANAAAQLTDWERDQLVAGMAKFTMADTDSDGILSRREFDDMGKQHYEQLEDKERKRYDPAKINQALEAEFKLYDKDANGLLTRDEWQKVTTYHITRHRDAVITQRAFEKADKDEDKHLTMDEIHAHFGPQGYKKEELETVMILGDENQDNLLSFKEFERGRGDFQTLIEHEKMLVEQEEKEKLRADLPAEEAVAVFKEHDKNGNGVLTPPEFIALIRSQVNTVDPKTGEFMEIPEESIIKTFKEYDRNKDIAVSLDEFTKVINGRIPDAHAAHDFDEADLNKDGKLSMNEYTILFDAFAKVMGQEDKDGKMALSTFKQHDKNKDGLLTSQEYRLSVALLKAEAEAEYNTKLAQEMEKGEKKEL